MKEIEKIEDLVLQLETFTPSSIARQYRISLSTALSICAEMEQRHPEIQKWFKVYCPDCDLYVWGFEDGTEPDDAGFCEECGKEVSSADESNLRVFYVNRKPRFFFHEQKAALVGLEPTQKDDVVPETDFAAKVGTPLKVSKAYGKSAEYLLSNETGSLIWQVSDLHICDSKKPFLNGHCSELRKTFFEIIEKRGSAKVSNDIFVISGDCTDNGTPKSEAVFKEFLQALKGLGVKSDNLLYIPGNHDAWNGCQRIPMYLRTLVGLPTEKYLLEKFVRYPARNLPESFLPFKSAPGLIVKRTINGLDIEFTLVNTTIPFETAKGVFPANVPFSQDKVDLKILVMHHHLIDNPGSLDVDYRNFKNVVAMRLLNHTLASSYIFDHKIDFALNGHKHFQYFKREFMPGSVSDSTYLISAPTLLENVYNKSKGDCVGDQTIGFNVLLAGKKRSKLFFFRLKNFRYQFHDYAELIR